MKRLALIVAVAAVVGGTGCGNTCNSGTTVVSWTGFDGPGAGTVNVPCGLANVASVDLWLDDQPVGNWPCDAYGATVPGVPTGGNILDVEGLDGSGTILFRDSLSFTQGCNTVGLSAFPGAGFVDVDYTFSPTNACYSPAPTYMWLEVNDDIAQQIAFADTGMTSAQVCDVTAPAPRYALPSGSYTLLGINEVLPSTAVVGADCTNRPFTVGAAQVTTVSPVLIDSSAACF